ncbi:MAG: hypothetical protein ACOVRK_05305, partial [Chryseobacterium taeanense]
MAKKRILFRMASMDRSCKAEELMDIIKNMDDEQFELSILLDHHEGSLLKDIPADIKVVSLIKKRRKKMSRKPIFFPLQQMYSNIQIPLYCCFPSHVKHKIRRFPDIEIAFAPGSLRGLLNSPFRESVKIFWFSGDITTKPGKGLARMMSRCNVTVFDSLHSKECFEKHLGFKVPRSLYIHPYINERKVLIQSSKSSLLIEEKLSGAEKIFVSV